MSSLAPSVPRATRSRRIDSRQFSTARSACGSAVIGAVLVAYDGHLAHLRQGHQPPVGRVLPGDALVEQHVLGRLHAGDVEVAQPPQVEATPDHRVHAAGQVVLDHASPSVSIGAEHVVADRPVAAGADGHADASYVVGQRKRGQQRPQLLARPRRRRGGVGPVQVEVDDRFLVVRTRRRRTPSPR